jgi:acetyl esterase/lipase
MPWLFLLVSVVGAAFTYNAVRPTYAPARPAVLSFAAGWLTSELAAHHIAWQAAATALFVWAGALAGWPGRLGLAVTVVSWGVLAAEWWRGRHSGRSVEDALVEGFGPAYATRVASALTAAAEHPRDWRSIARPFPIRHPEVERTRDVEFTRAAGLRLKLDVYRHRSRPSGCPTLLQIHGGAWILGRKDDQGLPLMTHMAARGWVCVSVNYRLSPLATFPDHLIDLKQALRWIREHGWEYGADPDFVVVTGGSAGGHLAALVALTANDPEYQPGFEQVDTTVQGCVPFYGVYDFADRHAVDRNDGRRNLLARRVMKASLADAREAYERASPISRLTATAPPFLVVHGDRDTLVPVQEARAFVREFRRVAPGRVAYAEIAGAQHAFEIFPSLRSTRVVRGVARFLTYLYDEHRAAHDRSRRASDSDTSATPPAPAASAAPR